MPPSGKNVSGAAIAGTVIGPICGVALLLGLAILFFRHRRSKQPAAGVSSNTLSPPPGPIVPFEYYISGKQELDAGNTPNPHRLASVPRAYRGTEDVATTAAMNNMVSPTMPHDVAELGINAPVGGIPQAYPPNTSYYVVDTV
jgi:hypothetical protein